MNLGNKNIEQCIKATLECARCGDYGLAASNWNKTIIQITQLPSFDELSQNAEFIKSFEIILNGQENHDWILIADELEYNLLPIFIRNL